MHFPKYDELRSDVQDNRDRDQIADRFKRALQKVHPVGLVE